MIDLPWERNLAKIIWPWGLMPTLPPCLVFLTSLKTRPLDHGFSHVTRSCLWQVRTLWLRCLGSVITTSCIRPSLSPKYLLPSSVALEIGLEGNTGVSVPGPRHAHSSDSPSLEGYINNQIYVCALFSSFFFYWCVQGFCRMVTIVTAEQEKWDFTPKMHIIGYLLKVANLPGLKHEDKGIWYGFIVVLT
jgi:hypothetical protein